MNEVKYPNINVDLSLSDGNAFAVLGKVRRAMIEAGISTEEIGNFMAESMSSDYNHLLATCMKWVNVS